MVFFYGTEDTGFMGRNDTEVRPYVGPTVSSELKIHEEKRGLSI